MAIFLLKVTKKEQKRFDRIFSSEHINQQNQSNPLNFLWFVRKTSQVFKRQEEVSEEFQNEILYFSPPKVLRLFVREKLRDRVFTVSIPQVSCSCLLIVCRCLLIVQDDSKKVANIILCSKSSAMGPNFARDIPQERLILLSLSKNYPKITIHDRVI